MSSKMGGVDVFGNLELEAIRTGEPESGRLRWDAVDAKLVFYIYDGSKKYVLPFN
jgi:hypothetical protein